MGVSIINAELSCVGGFVFISLLLPLFLLPRNDGLAIVLCLGGEGEDVVGGSHFKLCDLRLLNDMHDQMSIII